MTTTSNLDLNERRTLAASLSRQGFTRQQIATRLQVPSSTAYHLINEGMRAWSATMFAPIIDAALVAPAADDNSESAVIARRLLAASMRDLGFTFEQIANHIGRSVAATRAAVNAGRRARFVQPTSTWMDRSFGVEVEHTGTSLSASRRALVNAGLDAVEPGYTHRVMDEWKIVHDGSCGNEAVSPILSGTAGLDQLGTAMTALSGAGARVNTQCGMHVHVDMTGLDGAAIARLVTLYTDHQDDLDALVSSSRRRFNNSYCQAWGAGDTLAAAIDELRTSRSITSHYDRYRTINVMSFPRYGTIEFRQHQGTLAPKKAQAWVVLMLALVEIARIDRCADVATGDDFVTSVAHIVNMPADVRRRLVARRASLAARV